MSPGELRFIEPFLEKVCIMCASKGKWRRSHKNLVCTQCNAEYVVMPDRSLAVLSRPVVEPSAA